MIIEEILNEALKVVDMRTEWDGKPFVYKHKDTRRPPITISLNDPWTKKYSPYISPEDGFYFAYDKGHLDLFSFFNEEISFFLTNKRAGVSFNSLSGLVEFKSKTIKINKESANNSFRVRTLDDVISVRQCLKELMKYGVTSDFKIKHGNSHLPTKVGEFLKFKSVIEKYFANDATMVMYHGTTKERAEYILKNGLNPGMFSDTYPDFVPGYTDKNVYLIQSIKGAEFYAARQKRKDGEFFKELMLNKQNNKNFEFEPGKFYPTEQPVGAILKIIVPDPGRISPDDRFVVKPRWIIDGTKKDAFGNDVPNYVMEPIDQNAQRKSISDPHIIKSSFKTLGEVAYKGRIPPKFISLLKILK